MNPHMAAETFESHDPRTGEVLDCYHEASDDAISQACAQAAGAVADLRDDRARVHLLREAARRLRAAANSLHAVCERETGLPQVRLQSELERTCVQLELFATVVQDGGYVEAIIDTANPDAPVAPRQDLRRMLVALGPVAVFGASNFPYAFSVAGGDTASALAVGCPVVFKAHPSHPGTSELVASELHAALEEAGLPGEAFSLLQGAGNRVGARLVRADEIEAVAFTGSIPAGRALFDLAAARPRPIPVYAEMGSVNPIVLTSAALRARADAIAQDMTAAISAGTGQFCTKPGVVLVPDDSDGAAFISGVAERLDGVAAAPLLNGRIHAALQAALHDLDDDPDVKRVTARAGVENDGGYLQTPIAYAAEARVVATRPDLVQERFGPVVLLVRYSSAVELTDVLLALPGQLTATLHAQPEELDGLHDLVGRMETLAGRVIFDGFPPGVAVTHAMHHGGPYPATSAPSHTSVGSTATLRFQRPVVWQNAPAAMLPAALQDDNPLGIWRLVNGTLTRDPLSSTAG
jgi:2,5-dioxopentanoate dehydrogenase